jgi:hypothetical protein
MQKVITLAIVVALGWYGYTKYQGHITAEHVFEREATRMVSQAATLSPAVDQGASAFKCDGRTYCSQMTSCAEATYFLKNCPGTKMDGDNDGIPCEKQWCK